MDAHAVDRAIERLTDALGQRADRADVDAALARAREQLEELAQAATELNSTLPEKVEHALREGVRAEALPLARQVAEIRGLMNAVIRRLERLDGDLHSERHARVDDLAVLVDLITSGWRSVDQRLARMEEHLQTSGGAVVYRIEERR